MLILNKRSMTTLSGILILLILLTYSYIGGGFRALFHIAFIGSAVLMLTGFSAKLPKSILKGPTAWMGIILFLYLYRNHDIAHGYYGRFLYFLCCMLFLTFANAATYRFDKIIALIKFIGIAVTLYLLASWIAGNPIHDGNMLICSIMLLGICAGDFLCKKKRLQSGFWIMASVLAILVSEKLGPLLSLSVSMFLILCIHIRTGTKKGRALQNFIFLLSFPVLLYLLFNSIPVIIRLLQDNEFTNGRTLLYKRSWQLFLENPVFGSGWGGYRDIVHIAYGNFYYEVHNIYLQLLCETGLIGCTLFLCFFLKNIILVYSMLNTVENSEKNYFYFSLFGQLFFIFYGLTGNPLYDYWFYMYAICVGFILPLWKSVPLKYQNNKILKC